jgi:hypothetical protein
MMVGILSDILQIVVFTRYPQTRLGIGDPSVVRDSVPQEQILEWIHAGIGKQQRGITLNQQRSRSGNMMPFGSKKIQKNLSDLFGLHTHGIHSC